MERVEKTGAPASLAARQRTFESLGLTSTCALAVLLSLLGAFWVARASGVSSGGAPYGFRATAFAAVVTLFCVSHGWAGRGRRFIVRLLLVATGVSLVSETLGVLTGAIFGPYAYSAGFPAKIFGLVPLIIPFIWFSIAYLAFSTAQLLTAGARDSGGLGNRWGRSLLSALLMLGYDLVADPNHVFRGGWSYAGGGGFHGVPARNFGAWFVIGAAMFGVLSRDGRGASEAAIRTRFYASLPAIGYLGIVAHETLFAALVSRLYGAALVGLALSITMAVLIVRALSGARALRLERFDSGCIDRGETRGYP